MFIPEKTITLANGQPVLLRSPCPEDAEAMLEQLRQTSAETHYIARYPEEITVTAEAERTFLDAVYKDEDNFMLSAFLNEKLIANTGITRVRDHIKYRHRGMIGISVLKPYCNLGLGTALMKEALSAAQNTRFEQIELGVFSDNLRAIHMYEKLGFKMTGVLPRAYKLKDGTYRDEIQMIYIPEK